MPRLISIVDRLWNSTRHYRRAFMTLFGQEGDSVTHYEHRLLLAAIKRRDATDAERILAGHIRRTRIELGRHREIFQQTRDPLLSDSARGP
jgi:DNA-binding GntR family transcriptional regulator